MCPSHKLLRMYAEMHEGDGPVDMDNLIAAEVWHHVFGPDSEESIAVRSLGCETCKDELKVLMTGEFHPAVGKHYPLLGKVLR